MIRRTSLAVLLLLAVASCKKEIPVPVDPPEARKDYASTALNTPVTFAPLANDYDPTNQALSIVSLGAPAHGSVAINPGDTVTYTPNTGFLGGDEFTVTIQDTDGNLVTGTAYVTVGPTVRMAYSSNLDDYFISQVYLSDTAHPGVSIPINGRIPLTVGPVRPSVFADFFFPSPDGTKVVYRADQSTSNEIIDLYFTDLATVGKSKNMTSFLDGQAVGLLSSPALTPDNQHLLYLSNEFNPAIFELVETDVANPAHKVRVNPALATGESIQRFAVSPDGTRIVYLKRTPGALTTDPVIIELYVVDLSNPGVAMLVNGPRTTGTSGVGGTMEFVPNTNNKLVYVGEEGGSTTLDLYLVDYVALTAPVKLSGTALSTGIVVFGFTPDSSRVVYLSDESTSGVNDLYAAQLAVPGVSTRLSAAVPRSVTTFSIGQDSSYAMYVRDDVTTGVNELFAVNFATPTVHTKLNATLASTDDVNSIRISAGSPRTVLYSVTEAADSKLHIKSVSVDNPGVATDVGVPLLVTSDYRFAPDGQTVIFNDDPTKHSITSIWATTLAAPTVVTKISAEQFPGAAAAFPPAFLY